MGPKHHLCVLRVFAVQTIPLVTGDRQLDVQRRDIGTGLHLRQIGLIQPTLTVTVPGILIPQLELLALTHQGNALIQRGEAAQSRRQQHTPLAIHIHLLGVTDIEPLQHPRLLVERRELVELMFYLDPGGFGINQQTAVAIDGQDQARVTTGQQTLAVPRRYRESAFGIQTEERDSPEQHPSPFKQSLPFTPLSPTSRR